MTGTPETFRQRAWGAMSRGRSHAGHPARQPVLATAGTAGPSLRMVVLRGWANDVAEIQSDRATGKVEDLSNDPRAALLVWVPDDGLQIRLTGRAELIHGDRTRWENIPEGPRQVYGGTPPPGTPIERPEDHRPEPDPDRFTAIRIHVTGADILQIGEDRHSRARFSRGANGQWSGRWVAP